MKGKLLRTSLIFCICVMAGILIYFGLIRNGANVEGYTNYSVSFNRAEQEYIASHKTLHLYVDETLQYLVTDEEEGFLQDYLGEILAQADMELALTEEEARADARLLVVTDQLREQREELIFTAPVFQVTGKLYTKEDLHGKESLSGIAMDSRESQEALAQITYDDQQIRWQLAGTAEETVALATASDADCILGDASALTDAMEADDRYIGVREELYSRNGCIVTEASDEILAGILNQCIHSVDRSALSYRASQRWLGGQGPVYLQNDYGDVYILILIIFSAVLIAFYIYYQSNKNLYAELTDRMNKLTESKKELQTTFNGVGHWMAELSLTGEVIDINRAFYEFVAGESVNKKIWEVLDLAEEDREALKEALLGIRKKGALRNMEVTLRKQTLIIDVFPIENARGTMEKLLFMAMDVTNERMAERQMLQDNKMIAVGQLAAGVAHEIRNPLGIIRNYCYVLKTMKDEKVREKAVAQIEKAVDTSGVIINNLLNFSKTSSKGGEEIELKEHVNSLLTLNQGILKKKNIHLQLLCQQEIKTFLQVESLDMILINLVSNAIDAMEEEGRLTIAIRSDGDFGYIDVEDTGEGIEPDVIEEIFNPFFTTKGSRGGTGLGLYIVYNELNKMNGTISVKSEKGVGTSFTVAFPLENK